LAEITKGVANSERFQQTLPSSGSAEDQLDRFDIRILSILAERGRTSWSALAQLVGLSQTPTLRRVRALEARGFIVGYHAEIDEARLGLGMSVFVSVSLETQSDDALAAFEESVSQIPAVMNCYMMTGASDYLLRVVVRDLPAYQAFISTLTRSPGIARVTSSFAVKSVVQRSSPPFPIQVR
jgi:DNA-binding Lrp family transcriptional regulator